MELTVTSIKLFAWSLYLVGPILLLLTFFIVILGQIVTKIEKWEVFDGLYWSFITATTVGYGDIRPLKKIAKTLAVFIAFLGILLTGTILAVALKTVSIALEKHIDPAIIERINSDLE